MDQQQARAASVLSDETRAKTALDMKTEVAKSDLSERRDSTAQYRVPKPSATV